jgi:hypothetical protein
MLAPPDYDSSSLSSQCSLGVAGLRRVVPLTLQEKYRQSCHQGFSTGSIQLQIDRLIVTAHELQCTYEGRSREYIDIATLILSRFRQVITHYRLLSG